MAEAGQLALWTGPPGGFPNHVLLYGDRHKAVEGRQKGLCIAETRRQGEEAWGTQKSPGAEITQVFSQKCGAYTWPAA